MIAALEDRERLMATGAIGDRVHWRDTFARELEAQIREITFLAQGGEGIWNTLSVVMPEIDCRQRWVVKLDKGGAAVSTGSACASGKEKGSHVLAAMGLSAEIAGRVLRISSGWETTEDDWGKLMKIFRQVNESMRAEAPA